LIARLRASFAAKLVALEVGTIVIAVVALAGLLITSRLAQTRELEQNVGRSSVDGLRRELSDAGTNATQVAAGLAGYAPFVAGFPAPDTVRAEARYLTSDQTLVVVDGSGSGLVAFSGGSGSAQVAASRWSPAAAVAAVASGAPPTDGVLAAQGGHLELDGVAPVDRQGTRIGYVLDVVDPQALLRRVNSSAGNPVQYSIFYGGRRVATTFTAASTPSILPPDVQQAANQGQSFALTTIAGQTYAGYYTSIGTAGSEPVVLGAEFQDYVFAAVTLNDTLTVIFTTTLIGTVLTIVAIVFARRFALRPLRRLGEGAESVGRGDYGARVVVRGEDDFARLAATFNHMAQRIERSTAQLEEQRAHLDQALTSLGAVSRALTTTITGQAALREAVLDALLEVTGAPAAVMYGDGGQPVALRGTNASTARAVWAAPAVKAILGEGGGLVEVPRPGRAATQAVVVPMASRGGEAGALAAFAESGLGDIDLPAVTVLASQASVALENAELFDRERQTVERLQELDAMKSDFLATIQHELRTPLTAIIGLTDLLSMAWSNWNDEQKLDSLGEVQLAAKGLYDLVETILDYSMLESDRLRLTLMPCRVRDAVQAAVDDLEPVIAKRRAAIRVDVPVSLTAEADARRLGQVVRALLDNAIKFSPDAPSIRVTGGREADRVFLRVADRGIGIDPEDQELIFERFFQVDNTATRRYGGTGMGLALAQRLVTMHGGAIEVQSTPGAGATFTIWLQALPTGANGKAPARRKAPAKRAEAKRLESTRSR